MCWTTDITMHMCKNDGLEMFFFLYFHIREILSRWSVGVGLHFGRLPDDPGGITCMFVKISAVR